MAEKYENSSTKSKSKRKHDDPTRLSAQSILSDRTQQFSPFRAPFRDDVNMSCSRMNPNVSSSEINFSAPRKFFTLNQDPFKNKENSMFEAMSELELEEFALMCERGKENERRSMAKPKESLMAGSKHSAMEVPNTLEASKAGGRKKQSKADRDAHMSLDTNQNKLESGTKVRPSADNNEEKGKYLTNKKEEALPFFNERSSGDRRGAKREDKLPLFAKKEERPSLAAKKEEKREFAGFENIDGSNFTFKDGEIMNVLEKSKSPELTQEVGGEVSVNDKNEFTFKNITFNNIQSAEVGKPLNAAPEGPGAFASERKIEKLKKKVSLEREKLKALEEKLKEKDKIISDIQDDFTTLLDQNRILKKDLKEKAERIKFIETALDQRMLDLERKSVECERLGLQVENLRSELMNQKSIILNRTELEMEEHMGIGSTDRKSGKTHRNDSNIFGDQQESFTTYQRAPHQREASTSQKGGNYNMINHSLVQDVYESAPLVNLKNPMSGEESSREKIVQHNQTMVLNFIRDKFKIDTVEEIPKRLDFLYHDLGTHKKFYDCLTKVIMECSPNNTFKEKPSLKQAWKWIKNLMEEYMLMKTKIRKNSKSSNGHLIKDSEPQSGAASREERIFENKNVSEVFNNIQKNFGGTRFLADAGSK